MAWTASPTFSPPFPLKKPHHPKFRLTPTVGSASSVEPPSSSSSGDRKPFVDTRIHWSDPDEGWIGSSKPSSKEDDTADQKQQPLGARFADLINKSTDSHYQFLGVSPEADTEEIKAAYRRLSKEYHPDTTSLPLKSASEKFMQLREAYDVLGHDDRRRFYDWTLAQEAESRQEMRMRMRLEDPYEQDLRNYEPVPDMVDRLRGRNMKLSDQASTALVFDIFVIVFSICCIVYAVFFKEQY